MDNYVYIVAISIGSIMLLSVSFVYLKHHILQLNGVVFSAFAIMLLGMPVWKKINFSLNENGFTEKVEKAIEIANQAKQDAKFAKQETAKLRSENSNTKNATLALKNSFEAYKTQYALRTFGFYNGTPDGQFGQKTTNSLMKFQENKGLSKTGILDLDTAKELGIKPLKNFPAFDQKSLTNGSKN